MENLVEDLNNILQLNVDKELSVSNGKTHLYKAILKFNRLCIDRNIRIEKTAKNPHLGNKYANLDGIIDAISLAMTDADLIYTGEIEGDEFVGSIIEVHFGQSIASRRKLNTFYINRKNDPENKLPLTIQEFGSMITYLRRYFLSSLLNLSTDEEDDGNAGSGTKPKLGTTEKIQFKTKLAKKEVTIEELKEKYAISRDDEKFLLG